MMVGKTREAGSPPQVRGKLCGLFEGFSLPGITPAGAGKTTNSAARLSILWDHPRRCGENKISDRPWTHRGGSPPQVRGKRVPSLTLCHHTRITPAGAGKTICLSASRRWKGDHPRRCGENRTTLRTAGCRTGSPPQVRGKHPSVSHLKMPCRITPAGAGKTLRLRRCNNFI